MVGGSPPPQRGRSGEGGASHKACQEDGWWVVPPPQRGRSGEGGGSCPPMGEPSLNLVPLRLLEEATRYALYFSLTFATTPPISSTSHLTNYSCLTPRTWPLRHTLQEKKLTT